MADKPLLFIHGFGTEYVPERVSELVPNPIKPGASKEIMRPTGKMKERDWVEFSPMGGVQRTVVREWIERLACVQPLTGKGGENPAVAMANARWEAIRPHYEAWKKGQELPLEGTPLAAWNGISRQQADILKTHGVRTVEDLAQITDALKQTIGLMGLSALVENAKRFIVAQDKSSVTHALAEKDAQIAELKEQMAELVEMVKETQQAKPIEPPKRRGRPPKKQDEPSQPEAA